MAKVRILFQGDSITDCGRKNIGDSAGLHLNGLGPGYPMMIAAKLLCTYPEIEWDFINRGCSGHRIVDLYGRWKDQTINLEPDVLSILVGVNDSWHELMNRNGVEVPRYARFYRELLEWTKKELPDIKFVLMDPFVFTLIGETLKLADEIAERRAVVAELAKEFDAIHIRLQDIFDKACKRAPVTHWSADGVHPSMAGQYLITEEWCKAVTPMLLEIAKK